MISCIRLERDWAYIMFKDGILVFIKRGIALCWLLFKKKLVLQDAIHNLTKLKQEFEQIRLFKLNKKAIHEERLKIITFKN